MDEAVNGALGEPQICNCDCHKPGVTFHTRWALYRDEDFADDAKGDPQQVAELAIESLGHRVASIYDPQRGVLKLFIDQPEWMTPASLERADDDYRSRR